MSDSKGPSIFVPTDKNIYDALQHKKVTQSAIIKFLRDRGILVSNELNKDDLSEMVASLTLDYNDFIWITRQLENPNKKDKSTHSTFKAANELSDKNIKAACEALKKSVPDDESVKLVQSNGVTKIVVTYVDNDFTKTELRQRTVKKCEIELTKEGNEVSVNMPATKKAADLLKKIKTNLSNSSNSTIEEFNISLESLVNPEARSFFFDRLIRSVTGYNFDNVSVVDVYHSMDSLSEDDDTEQQGRVASYINKAVLAGGGVLESREFVQLHKRGFYISKIVWTIDENVQGGNRVELEAQFGNPKACSEFKYLVRGIYNYNEVKVEHNVTRRASTPLESKNLNQLLKIASETAYNETVSKYGV